jgi:alpha-L-fucosidase
MEIHRSSITRRSLLLATPLAAAGSALPSRPKSSPASYGALPSESQIRWSKLEFYNFLHFTVNTFTGREWGNGDEDPAVFNPTAFDADAICEALKSGGSQGVILTCKHHDGFCLWPTKTTNHCIRFSPYKKGKGDIVKEIADAALRHGLKFGVYLSPWDRNQAAYGRSRYIDIYRQQLRELLTGYGELFEIWHDGANGGSGYYGGAHETRTIDKAHYYDWANTWALERRLQPEAVRFSDVGPDVRWVGNEKGIAGETCWQTFTPVSQSGGPAVPGDVLEKESNRGTRGGRFWMPPECDVSIRPGWFWHAAESKKVKTPRELFDLYCVSVGRGANFLLNIPPDRRGLLDAVDAGMLQEFGKLRTASFTNNLAVTAQVEASNVRDKNPAFAAHHLIDGDAESYWATDDSITTPEVTFSFTQPVSFNLVRAREQIRLGQRIDAFELDYWDHGQWQRFAGASSIGPCRIVRAAGRIHTLRVRLRVTAAAVCPALSELAIFDAPV